MRTQENEYPEDREGESFTKGVIALIVIIFVVICLL